MSTFSVKFRGCQNIYFLALQRNRSNKHQSTLDTAFNRIVTEANRLGETIDAAKLTMVTDKG